MILIENIGMFIQDQILGMKWLNILLGEFLEKLGLDLTTRFGGSLKFFIYDTIKIFILLSVLIFIDVYKRQGIWCKF